MAGRGRPDRMSRWPACAFRRKARASCAAHLGRRAPSAARLARDRPDARRGAESTNVASAAPRESASRPSAPEPAKRSSTRTPSIGAEHREQRLAHPVGRRPRRARRRGAASRRPPRRTGDDPHAGIGSSASAPKRATSASASSTCSGSLQLGVGGDQPLGARACARSSSVRELGDVGTRRPDWRVPMSSPSPRSRGRPRRAGSRRGARPARAAARTPWARTAGTATRARRGRPPAQLVQLGDAVALGVLDEHHGRVRDVDPDLDDRRRHEHVGAARGEARHRRLLLARAHLPVQQHDAEVRELALRQPLVLGGRGARLERLGLLDERAHDERLAAGAQLLADALVGARALALAVERRASSIGRRPRGQLAQHRHIEVAVRGQRERARDRRGGHVQDVRAGVPAAPLRVERRALAHAEAVLLVDDRDREPVELAPSSSISACVPTTIDSSPERSLRERVVAARGGRRAGEQRERDRARPASASGSSRSAARRASRSAPSAPPACRARPRAASPTAPRPSCPSRPRPSAAAASGGSRASSASSAAIARAGRRSA